MMFCDRFRFVVEIVLCKVVRLCCLSYVVNVVVLMCSVFGRVVVGWLCIF